MTEDYDMDVGDLGHAIRCDFIEFHLEPWDTPLVVEEVRVGGGAHLEHALLSAFFADPDAHFLVLGDYFYLVYLIA